MIASAVANARLLTVILFVIIGILVSQSSITCPDQQQRTVDDNRSCYKTNKTVEMREIHHVENLILTKKTKRSKHLYIHCS